VEQVTEAKKVAAEQVAEVKVTTEAAAEATKTAEEINKEKVNYEQVSQILSEMLTKMKEKDKSPEVVKKRKHTENSVINQNKVSKLII